MHVTQIKIWLITRKWPNIFWYLAEWYLIFASRSNTLTLNHQFFALPTIRLRLQRFAIRLAVNLEAGPRFAGICLLPNQSLGSFLIASIRTISFRLPSITWTNFNKVRWFAYLEVYAEGMRCRHPVSWTHLEQVVDRHFQDCHGDPEALPEKNNYRIVE